MEFFCLCNALRMLAKAKEKNEQVREKAKTENKKERKSNKKENQRENKRANNNKTKKLYTLWGNSHEQARPVAWLIIYTKNKMLTVVA